MHKRTFCLQRCVFDVLPTLLDEVKKLWPTPRPTRGNEWMEAVERVGQNTTYQSHGKHERGSETARRSVWIHFVISRSGVRVRLPAPSFRFSAQVNMGEFPSGQRGQTVNLLSVTSVVRIHLPPPRKSLRLMAWRFFFLKGGRIRLPWSRQDLWVPSRFMRKIVCR